MNKLMQLLAQHGAIVVGAGTVNTNGTTWLHGDGGWRVLVDDVCSAAQVTLSTLVSEYEVLEVERNGVVLY
jgi:hypothetical protein